MIRIKRKLQEQADRVDVRAMSPAEGRRYADVAAPTAAHSVLPTSSTVVPTAGRSRAPAVLMGLAAISTAYLAMLAVTPGGAELTVKASDVITTVAATAAALTCALTGRRHAGALRAFWWLLASACTAWAIGEGTWTWYEVVLREQVPYPSWADVGYLAGTPLAVAAFACHPAARSRRHRQRIIPLLDGIAAATALLLTSWTLVLSPLWDHTGAFSAGDLISIAYPFGDVVILMLLVLALRNLPAGNRPATALLFIGLLVMAGTDSAYTYLAQVDQYQSGDLIDAGWLAAYLAIAAAARLYESPAASTKVAPPSSPLTEVLAPYVPIMVALGVIAVEVPRGRDLTGIEWGIALCLTVLVVVRQLLALAWARGSRFATPQPVPVTRTARDALAAPSAAPRGELANLTLQIVAASRPAAQARAKRVSGVLVMALTSLAGLVAVWDMTVLIRSAGGGAA
jgi:hypothetical protein